MNRRSWILAIVALLFGVRPASAKGLSLRWGYPRRVAPVEIGSEIVPWAQHPQWVWKVMLENSLNGDDDLPTS
jgi:hypothetical protein